MSNINYSLDFELSDNNFIPNLFGVNDKNIQILEKVNNVQIKYRGNKIKIIGTKSSIKNTKEEAIETTKVESKNIIDFFSSNNFVNNANKAHTSYI